jgi:hypothetical protein
MAMGAFDIPVVLFLFKRKDSALRVLDRIRQVRPSRLYLLSDQGRDRHERALVAEVRESVQEAIDWDCEVVRRYAPVNRGVYRNIALGARWIFEREECAIFLEDDNLPEVTFFSYCAELLERYRCDTRIVWVCGTNYLGRYEPDNGASYMFTRHLLPCGWASWGSKFNAFYDFDLDLLSSKELTKRMRYEYSDPRLYRQQLRSVRAEEGRSIIGEQYLSWDYHMAWSIRAHGLYGISPAVNQIRNIGVDHLSEHGGTSMKMEMTRRFCGMNSYEIPGPLIHPLTVLSDRVYEEKIGRLILLPTSSRMKAGIRRVLGALLGVAADVSLSGRVRSRIQRLRGTR